MELRHLRYFAAVAGKLNFSRAADELHVAQPAISQQVRMLERELGVQLFDRVGGKVTLTKAGEALLPHALRILAAVETARHEVNELGTLTRGTASLGAPPTVSGNLLPAALSRFKRVFPGLEVTLREAGTERLLKLVDGGELDLAIVVTDRLPPAMEQQPFLTEHY